MLTYYQGTARERRALGAYIKLLRSADSVRNRAMDHLAGDASPATYDEQRREDLRLLGSLGPSGVIAQGQFMPETGTKYGKPAKGVKAYRKGILMKERAVLSQRTRRLLSDPE